MKIRYLIATAAVALSGAAANAQEYCREYTDGVFVGGVRQSGYGTACMMPDGAWRITPGASYNQPYSQPVVQPVYIQNTQYVPVPSYGYYPSYYNPYRRPYSPVSFSFNFSDNDRHYHRNRSNNWKWNNGHGNGHGRGNGRHH